MLVPAWGKYKAGLVGGEKGFVEEDSSRQGYFVGYDTK